MKHTLLALVGVLAVHPALSAAEIHVATDGNDGNPGTRQAPLRRVQAAAERAQPGDTVLVHRGTYRERINPPRGGESDARRIVYQAAPGEEVVLKGSEVVGNWVKVRHDTWTSTVPNRLFGRFNPYSDLIRGDWFEPRGRPHHTGAVYLNGDWLIEAARLDDVLGPVAAASPGLWFARVDAERTTLWAQFKGVDPNRQLVEINVRQSVFYPDRPGRNFITVRGFVLRHAATPWAPPTAEQVGLLGTHWSKGWVIENNTISHSVCSGIALGKHGDRFDNTSANTAEGYVKTIERAHAHPIAWTKENIGHHLVRNNRVSHCEQAGIVGSLGAAFSTIRDNTVHDIHVRRLFGGAEMAGIKLHAALDTTISGNHISRTCRGLWLDWMAQGTRVSRNLFHDNASEDLFVEVNHGPFLVDHNLFLSRVSILDMSQGGAYAHNLFAGKIISTKELSRQTPYHPAHSTTVAGLSAIRGGDNRYHNNLFLGGGDQPLDRGGKAHPHGRVAGFGLQVYDGRDYPLQASGNVYLHGARPAAKEARALVVADGKPDLALLEKEGRVTLRLLLPEALGKAATTPVTTRLLGEARIPRLPYVQPDGSPVTLDRDYAGKRRDPTPTPGPFEQPGHGVVTLPLR